MPYFTDHDSNPGAGSYERLIGERLFAVQRGEIVDSEADALRTAMVACRSNFVAMMGWRAATKEGCDIADLNPATIHMARFDGDVAATTMRLAPFEIDNIRRDSLSVGEMLNGRPEMQRDAIEEINKILEYAGVDRKNVELYDLTRLAPDLVNPTSHTSKESILQDTATMIGIGIRETDALRDDDDGVVVWTFCLHPSMKELLDDMGIQSSVLVKGVITEGDDYESIVCVAFPKSAYRFVVDDYDRYGDDSRHIFTYRHVTNGINS